MRFETLQFRFVELLRRRVRNGDSTERALARLTGISQPHFHHLLKGARGLNAEIADRILERLGLSLLDLIEPVEFSSRLARTEIASGAAVELSVLRARIGPGLPWSNEVSIFERIAIARPDLAGIRSPVVARLAHDARMTPLLKSGDLVLLDADEHVRNRLDPHSLFVVEKNGESVVRWIRRGSRCWYLLSADCRDRPLEWERLRIEGNPLDVIKARAILANPLPLPGPDSSQTQRSPDKFPGPVRRSVPN